jgi:uncharacterized membrane protein YedE/YeeE
MRFSFLIFVPLGLVFGLVLSRAGATTQDFYAHLFLLQDLQLLQVIGTAAVVGALGVGLLRRLGGRSLLTREDLSFKGKPFTKKLIPGSVVFGLGWGLAGACPGTAIAMLGEGKLGALATIVGVFIGTWTFGFFKSKPVRVHDFAQAEAPAPA